MKDQELIQNLKIMRDSQNEIANLVLKLNLTLLRMQMKEKYEELKLKILQSIF